MRRLWYIPFVFLVIVDFVLMFLADLVNIIIKWMGIYSERCWTKIKGKGDDE